MRNESNVKTNVEIRRWYLEQVAYIPELNKQWLEQGLSLRARAEAAWSIRHEARLKARAMMADPSEVELLRERDMAEYGDPDGPTFEFLLKQLQENGLKEMRYIMRSLKAHTEQTRG